MFTKLYRSFNSLYSKISKADEPLILSLVKTFCVPVIMFCLEALDLNTSTLAVIDTPMFNAMAKIFKTFDRNSLGWCMFYMDCLPSRHLYHKNKINFLSKMKSIDNSLIGYLFRLSGKVELARTLSNLAIDDVHCARQGLWKLFVNNLV